MVKTATGPRSDEVSYVVGQLLVALRTRREHPECGLTIEPALNA